MSKDNCPRVLCYLLIERCSSIYGARLFIFIVSLVSMRLGGLRNVWKWGLQALSI